MWGRRAARLDTAAIWSASSACCIPSRKPNPRIANIFSWSFPGGNNRGGTSHWFECGATEFGTSHLFEIVSGKNRNIPGRACVGFDHNKQRKQREKPMTRLKILAAAILASALASPAMAQQAVDQGGAKTGQKTSQKASQNQRQDLHQGQRQVAY